jgi:cobalt-zinc-cadmium efflux system membrane fusion protein
MKSNSEYKRIKELFIENIGTQKELILAESAYKSEKARYTSLKIKLEKIGLDVTKIEDCSFYDSFSIRSPIKGYITRLNVTNGQYVDQQITIAEIVDIEQLQIELSVFDNDINKLRTGQPLNFYLTGQKKHSIPARLSAVGKTIDIETKAIKCFAEIKNQGDFHVINNQFVEGHIIVDSVYNYALPADAFIKSENDNYILMLVKETEDRYFFIPVKMDTGNKYKDFLEIDNSFTDKKVLISGVYNIQIE